MSQSILRLQIGGSSRFQKGMYYNRDCSRQTVELFRLLADDIRRSWLGWSIKNNVQWTVLVRRQNWWSVMERISLNMGFLSTTWSTSRRTYGKISHRWVSWETRWVSWEIFSRLRNYRKTSSHGEFHWATLAPDRRPGLPACISWAQSSQCSKHVLQYSRMIGKSRESRQALSLDPTESVQLAGAQHWIVRESLSPWMLTAWLHRILVRGFFPQQFSFGSPLTPTKAFYNTIRLENRVITSWFTT